MTLASTLRTIRTGAALAAPLMLASTLTAQVQPDDLLVAYSASGNDSSVTEYDPSGAVVNQIASTAWTGFTSCAVTPAGELVINRGSGNRIEVHAYDGTLLNDFYPTAALGAAWDIDVFSDGAIAICAKDVGVVLYNVDGDHLDTFAPAGIEYPFGCHITGSDLLWVVDRQLSIPGLSRVWQFDRSGAVLRTFDVDFDASDIVRSVDGTLWLSDYSAGRVVQYTQDGTQLTAFDVQIDSTLRTLWSLAIDASGSIITSGHYDSHVRYYTPTGTLISEYDTGEPGNSLYMTVPTFGDLGTPYCFGDGSGGVCGCGNPGGLGEGCANSTGGGATLLATGSPVVELDTLEFEARGMIPNQPALLFVGENAVNGGDGTLFGDGLRCAGGAVVRLGVRTPDAGGGASWGPGLAAAGGWQPGDVRYFQVWYRDPSPSGPCGSGFNLSHGLQFEFQ
jgi:hypothetical protein